MICKCGSRLKVVDTQSLNKETFRRYRCPDCGEVRWSHEVLANEEESAELRRMINKIRDNK